MKALVFENPWSVSVRERNDPQLRNENDVIIKISVTGICGTDIGIISGKYNASKSVIIGHESAGQVIKVGNKVSLVSVGDRVVINPTYYCGSCEMCLTDRPNHCIFKNGTEAGVSYDGTFATYYLTNEKFLHRISDNISFEEACLTEPLSCTLTGINQIRIRPEAKAVIFGAGPMGFLYGYVLQLHGITPAFVEINRNRRNMCKEIFNPINGVYENIADVTENYSKYFDIVIDTTGILLESIFPYLNKGSQFLSVGLKDKKISINQRDIADKSISILGSIDTIGTFNTAIYLIENNIIPVKNIITHKFELEDYELAFQKTGLDIKKKMMTDYYEGLKVILVPCKN